MEAGRVICTPRSPSCAACPIAAFCRARERNTQEQRPVKKRRARTPHYDVAAGVIQHGDGRFMIAQRGPDSMLGGLWESPAASASPASRSANACSAKSARSWASVSRSATRSGRSARLHAFPHHAVRVHVPLRQRRPQGERVADWAWVTLDDLERYAFRSPTRSSSPCCATAAAAWHGPDLTSLTYRYLSI